MRPIPVPATPAAGDALGYSRASAVLVLVWLPARHPDGRPPDPALTRATSRSPGPTARGFLLDGFSERIHGRSHSRQEDPMVVVMAPDATQARHGRDRRSRARRRAGRRSSPAACPAPSSAWSATWTQFGALNLRSMPGVSDVVRISVPYKLVSREHHPDRSVVRVGGVPIGPDTLTVIAGPCAVEIAGADADRGPDGQGGGRVAAARRRVQAAHLPLRLPGAGRGRAEDPGRGRRRDRAARGDRGDRPARRGTGLRLRRHAPGRHPQHAELRAAPGGRLGRQAGAAQARASAPPSRNG